MTLRRLCASAAGLGALLALALPFQAVAGEGVHAHEPVSLWLTTADRAHLLERQPAPASSAAVPAGAAVISVDPHKTYQSMVGFGAAITDASAWVIRHDLPSAESRRLMRELFSPSGLGLSFTRLTIGASDFSRTDYSYDDMPAGQSDPSLEHFSIAPVRADVAPVVREALSLNPQITIMASPWSAPGWMKTTHSLIKGDLSPDAFSYFADYLVRYVEAMKGEGVPIWALTVQNEPGFEPDTYPGMHLPPAARARLDGEFLGPELAAHGLKTRILDYDHNWDKPDSPLAVLKEPKANRYISGVAWHCYNGDVSAQVPVHDAFPDKDAFFTECSGGEWSSDFGETFDGMMQSLMIGSTRGWARGVLFWNLALDENHGPHLGGCGDCRGVVTVDSKTGRVTRNIEYYALGHLSRFVRPGAQRIEAESSSTEVKTVAFRNAGRGSIAVVVLNTAKADRTVRVDAAGRQAEFVLPGQAAATLVLEPTPRRKGA
jgi:glucosylceramidase